MVITSYSFDYPWVRRSVYASRSRWSHNPALGLRCNSSVSHIERGGAKRLIAPAEEVLALRPELQPATWRFAGTGLNQNQ